VNHTRLPKEDHLPDSARRDNKDTKGDRVYCVHSTCHWSPSSAGRFGHIWFLYIGIYYYPSIHAYVFQV